MRDKYSEISVNCGLNETSQLQSSYKCEAINSKLRSAVHSSIYAYNKLRLRNTNRTRRSVCIKNYDAHYLHYTKGAQIFQKSRSHLKILGARRVIWSKFHTEDPQILGVIVEKVVARATWYPGFVHHCTTRFHLLHIKTSCIQLYT